MKKVGELLKAEREKRGLSLHEIGMSLKINPKILQSIEDGNTAGLPAKTFLRGFIRSYAQYLRLDVDQVLALFQQEMGPTRPEEPQNAADASTNTTETAAPVKVERLSRKSEEPAIPQGNRGMKIYTIVGAIVLLLAIGFVVRMIEKYQKESEVVQVENATPIEQTAEVTVPISSNADGSTPIATESSTTTTLAGVLAASSASTTTTTLKPATPSAIVAPLATTTTTAKPTVTTLAPTTTSTRPSTTTTSTTRPVTTTTLKPTTTTVTTTTRPPTTTTTTSTTRPPTTTTTRPVTTTTVKPTTTTVPAGLITSPPSTTTTIKPKAGPVEVIAEATGNVTVRYNLGEGSWQTVEMTAGQLHTFKGKSGVTMEVSNGGALSVIVNGRDRGTAGPAGKPATLTYP